MEKLLRAKEVAGILRLNDQTVLRYIREGKLKAIKVGKQYLISESVLEEYITNNTMVSVDPVELSDGAGDLELSTPAPVDTETPVNI